jgi:hypothetical protein
MKKTFFRVATLATAAMALAACGGSTTDEAGPAEEPGQTTPAISIDVQPDIQSGHNLFIEVDDFTINPAAASTDPVAGEGHLHLYIDGERVMRFYNTALHLADLTPGEHIIEVEVSHNDHSAYQTDDVPIRASQTVTVEEGTANSHHANDPAEFAGSDVPSASITVVKDPKLGWNMSAAIENFTITPDNASADAVDGEGHLHLYIDGERVTRLYGTDWHIDELTEGSHEIGVEFSHNDHRAYAVDGTPIRGTATVEVTANEAMAADDHGHGEDEMAIPVADADIRIEASVSDGELTVDDSRFEVDLGSTLAIIVESDVADHVHVHGYDLFGEIEPGVPVEMVFVADVPGVFEVELEDSGTFLFEIQVS